MTSASCPPAPPPRPPRKKQTTYPHPNPHSDSPCISGRAFAVSVSFERLALIQPPGVQEKHVRLGRQLPQGTRPFARPVWPLGSVYVWSLGSVYDWPWALSTSDTWAPHLTPWLCLRLTLGSVYVWHLGSTSDPLALSTSDPWALSTSDPWALSTSDPWASHLTSGFCPHLTPGLHIWPLDSVHIWPLGSVHIWPPGLCSHLTPRLCPHLTAGSCPRLTPGLHIWPPGSVHIWPLGFTSDPWTLSTSEPWAVHVWPLGSDHIWPISSVHEDPFCFSAELRLAASVKTGLQQLGTVNATTSRASFRATGTTIQHSLFFAQASSVRLHHCKIASNGLLTSKAHTLNHVFWRSVPTDYSRQQQIIVKRT